MFEIRIGTPGENWNPGDDITELTYSENAILVKDQSYLVEHLASKGIALEEVNFFKWQAFPNRSYGKFLVSEAEWVDLIGAPQQGDDKPRLASLTIYDENTSKTFTNLEIVNTAFLMSPVYPVGPLYQDGSRILVIELEHNGMNAEYRCTKRVYKAFDTFNDIKALFSNGISLTAPTKYNRHNIPNVPLVDYAAYVTSSLFLTSFLPPGSSTPEIAFGKFVLPSTGYQLLYDKVSTIDRPLKIEVVLKSDSVCSDDYTTSDATPLVLFDTLYRSPVNANTEVNNIQVVIPYALYDHIENEYVAGAAKTEANRFASSLAINASSRLTRTIDVIYQGLVPGSITNDIQCITYYYQGNKFGLRTRLQSIPWEVHQCVLSHLDKCKDSVFRGVLLSNLSNSIASAVILRTKNEVEIVEYQKIVRDPIGAFTGIKKGSSVLLYKSCSGEYDNVCEYDIIQSLCPSAEPSSTMGKCVITGYCWNTVEAVCDKLNGTWTAGATCSSTPFGD